MNIDFDGGYVYMFPFCAERAQSFIQLNQEFESDYKRYWRDQQALRTGKRQTVVSLDCEVDEEGTHIIDTLASGDTPESVFLSREYIIGHRAAFDSLTEADQELLLEYLHAGCNARELARCLGKDPSGVSKYLKRAGDRLLKNIQKNS